MKHLISFNESIFTNFNDEYKYLSDFLQSEVLDDYNILKGDFNYFENGWENNTHWYFRFFDGVYHSIIILPEKRFTDEGMKTNKKIINDIELIKDRSEDFLNINYIIIDHTNHIEIKIVE